MRTHAFKPWESLYGFIIALVTSVVQDVSLNVLVEVSGFIITLVMFIKP